MRWLFKNLFFNLRSVKRCYHALKNFTFIKKKLTNRYNRFIKSLQQTLSLQNNSRSAARLLVNPLSTFPPPLFHLANSLAAPSTSLRFSFRRRVEFLKALHPTLNAKETNAEYWAAFNWSYSTLLLMHLSNVPSCVSNKDEAWASVNGGIILSQGCAWHAYP